MVLDLSHPGKPTQNAFIEAFNCHFRTECLNQYGFMTFTNAAEKLKVLHRDYNEVRLHSAIGYNVPIDVHIPGDATSPSR